MRALVELFHSMRIVSDDTNKTTGTPLDFFNDPFDGKILQEISERCWAALQEEGKFTVEGSKADKLFNFGTNH